MKQAWQNLALKYDALSLRERAIIALLVVVVLFVIWNELLMRSLESERLIINQNINSTRSQIDNLNKQAEAVIQAATVDPNKTDRIKLDRLQQKLSELDTALREKLHGMISPTDMARALEAVLVQQTELRLLKVQSIKAEPLFVAPRDNQTDVETSAEQPQVGIYKHGLQIEFSGGYLSTLEYLQALEALPWNFYWDGLELNVEQYPRSRVIIKVYTLSLDKDWIGV
ncbi:MAG: hypothetical protein PVJ63_01155 [Thioalkalispiraceae bacterium]|jgi:MSHA biogenesis protein MshJ